MSKKKCLNFIILFLILVGGIYLILKPNFGYVGVANPFEILYEEFVIE